MNVLRNLIRYHKPIIVVLVEPRTSGDKANKVIQKLGFADSHRVDAYGFVGGIWVVWRDDIVDDIICNNLQFIHMYIIKGNYNIGFLTAVCGCPNKSVKRRLWKDLSDIAESMNDRWLLAGDFNDLLSETEKRGRRSNRSGACRDFQDFVFCNSLTNLGFVRANFTWKRVYNLTD